MAGASIGDGITLIDALYDTDGQMILNARALGRQPSELKNIISIHAYRWINL